MSTVREGEALKKSLTFYQTIGFLFTGITGSLLHFLYEWTNESILIAPFSAVNESVWEHMKLLFYPMFIFAVAEKPFLISRYRSFHCAKLSGTVVGLLIIPVLYYTYTGALGVSADWFNIAIFFIAAAAAYFTETLIMKSVGSSCRFPSLVFIILCLIALSFVLLTFIQPEIPLFRDPVTGIYGIKTQ